MGAEPGRRFLIQPDAKLEPESLLYIADPTLVIQSVGVLFVDDRHVSALFTHGCEALRAALHFVLQ